MGISVLILGLLVVVVSMHMPFVECCKCVVIALFSAVEFEGLNTVDGTVVGSYTQPPLFELEKDLVVHKCDLPRPPQRSA